MLTTVVCFTEIARLQIAVPNYWLGRMVQDTIVSAAPAKPTAILQENDSKAEKDNGKKREEEAEKLEVKQDEEKKEEKKKESRKKDEKTSKKEKENKQTERKEKIEQLEGNKEEEQQRDLNPIVTPVSDDDELPAETQKKAKVLTQMAVNITQEEEEDKNIEGTQRSDLHQSVI
ncbi:unnamed protein product [Brugia pahangi]|uniref:Glutamic acid-rich protein-like n=1 Tax=Brugia pahangi TaxID=6280 RepID=A0A0N4TKU8_BRUPA|nr:unnamed protein product [Brugia pahangi]